MVREICSLFLNMLISPMENLNISYIGHNKKNSRPCQNIPAKFKPNECIFCVGAKNRIQGFSFSQDGPFNARR